VTQPLAIYLNDHLAGSLAGLELATYLETVDFPRGAADVAAQLREDIAADRQQLEAIIERLDVKESYPRQVATWLLEKIAELKARWDDRSEGALRLLEILEALALGIEGKEALWTALRSVAVDEPALRLLDYDRLVGRARRQRERVEALRLMAASLAFTSSSHGSISTHRALKSTTGRADRNGDWNIDRPSVLAIVQGAYFLGTGVWPLVHMRSFEAVTGPKVDKWLVRTVGVLVSMIGATLLSVGFGRAVTGNIVTLAAGSAAGLAAIDARYGTPGRISRIYLADAVIEASFVAAWMTCRQQSRAD
jgi:hypothetical protein